ncbi:MAG TPA: heavy metal translocating P-type ATPase metal-binding domain-containing protein [Bdellovibrionales bacterium]|nr:heavy metal translocating P-type ATPase metal-binding domain-containing protein [Bdellovibrionales bacterium]
METALATAACKHCGTLFPPTTQNDLFCCRGCETVYGFLQAQNLGRFYELKQNEGVCSLPADVSSEDYAFFDDPIALSRFSSDGIRFRFFLEGLNCTACLWVLEKLPQICKDVERVEVNMARSTVFIEKTAEGRVSAIASYLNRLGYKPHLIKESDEATSLRASERRRDLIRIGVSAAATGNIMLMAVGLYAGATSEFAFSFRWISTILAIPVLTYGAWPFYRSAWASFRARRLNLDIPIVVAILAGITASIWALATNAESLYFDSLSMLTVLLLSSRFLLRSIQDSHLTTANLVEDFLFTSVKRFLPDSQSETVSSLSLKPGDLILVSGDMRIPVDGHVEQGRGLIDTSVMTGESAASEISPGTLVEAGSRNLDSEWLLRVDRGATQSRFAQILKDTERSAIGKSEISSLADRVSQWFVGSVLVLAFLTLAYFGLHDAEDGVSRALTLVIVTCPCVFGMAIPLSMTLAVREAAHHGIVIKDASAIERLWKIRNIFFDKTGTLTKGEMSVLSMNATDETLQIAAALEVGQIHPVARAITQLLSHRKNPLSAKNVRTLIGGGISGDVNQLPYSIQPLDTDVQAHSTPDSELNSVYGLFLRDDLIASFEIGDSPRVEARMALDRLRAMGPTLHLISGDRAKVVEACAKLLGFDQQASTIYSRMTPELKQETMHSFGRGTAMVGDGANDAAALASADVGIAVRGSMEVSLRAADIYLSRPSLLLIPFIFDIAFQTRRAILRNLAFSTTFNLVAGGLAIAGLMTPLWAAVLMPLSSVTVLLSALVTTRGFRKALIV